MCPGELPEYYMVYFESGQGDCPPFMSEDLKATQRFSPSTLCVQSSHEAHQRLFSSKVAYGLCGCMCMHG